MLKGLTRRVGAVWKAATMRFGTGVTWFRFPRSRFNYAGEVDAINNSAVGATVDWIARNFPEAPFQTLKAEGEQWKAVAGHPMTLLIERPNPYYPGPLLWMATLADFVLDGNAYWRKVRNGVNGVIQLWWIPSQLIEPKWSDSDPTVYISHYEYNPGGDTPERIDPRDVVHFRWGLDPDNVRKGLSPMKSLLREIFTDDEAAAYTAAILRNLGVPGVVISPDSDDMELERSDADSIRDDFTTRFTGDGRGGPMVLSGKSKVTVLSFSPEQMNLRDLRRIPEERITARIGIPAIVVGLGAGLDRSTFANMSEARSSAYENGIIPIQRLCNATIDVQLLPDFEAAPSWRSGFDLTKVRVLQEDVDKLFARFDLAVKGGWVMVGEARRAVGLEAGPEHDYYLRGLSTEEVTAAEQIRIPEPVPAALASATPPAPDIPKAFKDRGDEIRIQRERAITAAARRIAGALSRLGARVGDRLGKADADIPDADFAELMQVLRRLHVEAVVRASSDAAGMVDASPLELDAPVTRSLLETLGDRIVGITEETRRQVAAAVLRAQEDGTPAADLGRIIRDLGAFSESRAATIARTELSTAENLSAAATWRASGFVENVQILDGDGCGWKSHDDPDKAHGTTRSLDDFEENTSAHPNCVRVGVPVISKARSNGARAKVVA